MMIKKLIYILGWSVLLIGCTQKEHELDRYPVRYHLNGYEFAVKDSKGEKVGPQGNVFSSSSEHVFQDEAGAIHLKLIETDGDWLASEIICTSDFGYGTYEWTLEGALDQLDANVMVSPFLYKDDQNEIDFEFSTFEENENEEDASWLKQGNYQFIVQPYDQRGHSIRPETPLQLSYDEGIPIISFKLLYTETHIKFQMYHGHLGSTNLIDEWEFVKQNSNEQWPDPKQMHFRLNVYLREGDAPLNNSDVEVVLKNFKFTK